MKFDLAVLDMAGTTVYDGDAVHTCLQEALLHTVRVKISRDEANEVMGIPKPVAIASLLRLKTSKAEPSAELVSEILHEFEERMGSFYSSSSTIREVPGASMVFKQMKAAGMRVVLDTGFSCRIAKIVIDRLKWEQNGLIDAFVASDEVAAGRPAPDLIYRAMELTQVTDAARVVKVGDTPSDLQQGENAGCGMIVGVTEGSHTAAQLRPFKHTHLIGTIRELPSLLALPGV